MRRPTVSIGLREGPGQLRSRPDGASGTRTDDPDSAKREAFEDEALVHLDDLYGLALRLTGGDETRSEDLVQEAMLKAYRAWDSFETGTNCRAWLMTILRNLFINEFRKQKSRPTLVEYDDRAVAGESDLPGSAFTAVRDNDPEGNFFEQIVDDEVVGAIKELAEEFRLPLVLSDLEGLSYREATGIIVVGI